ncbi:MAG: hypothetical protein Kow0069_05510 [Promethearchaeota archaeon]
MTPTRESKAWDLPFVASLALLTAWYLIFHDSYPVGNNFDRERFYGLWLFLPALLAMFSTALALRLAERGGSVVRFAAGAVVAASFASGFLVLGFEARHGDAPAFVLAWLAVYRPWAFSATTAAIASFAVACTFRRAAKFSRERVSPPDLAEWVVKHAALAAAGAFSLIVVVDQWSVGLALVGGGVAAGASWTLRDLVERRVDAEAPKEAGASRAPPAGTPPPARSIVLAAFSLLLFGVVASFLWQVDLVRPAAGGGTTYFPLNERQVLLEATLAAGALAGIVAAAWPVARKLARYALGGGARTATLAACVPAWLTWGLQNLGRSFLPLRYSTAVLPWAVLALVTWSLRFLSSHPRPVPGRTGALVACLATGAWGGLLFGPDEEFAGWVVSAVLLVATLSLLAAERSTRGAGAKREMVADRRVSEPRGAAPPGGRQLPRKDPRPANRNKAVALALLVLVPTFPVAITAHSSQFQLLANVDDQCALYLADPTVRVHANFKPHLLLSGFKVADPTVRLAAARGESESFQVVALPLNQKHYSVYGVEFGGLERVGGGGSIPSTEETFRAYRVEPVEALSNLVPDRLVEFAPFAFADGANHALWFTITVPADAPAGEYRGPLTISVDNKTNPLDWHQPAEVVLDVRLRVWDFALPDAPTLRSNFGLWYSDPAEVERIRAEFKSHRMMEWAKLPLPAFDVDSDGSVARVYFDALEGRVEDLHAHGSHSIGFDVGVPPLNATPSNPQRVGDAWFSAANFSACPTFNSTLAEYFDLLEGFLRDRGWFDEFYLVGHDEVQARPAGERRTALEEYRWLKRVVNASLPIMQTVMGDDPEAEAPGLLEDVDVVCWHTQGSEPEFVTEWKAAGKQVWIYTTRGPRFPVPSISTAGLGVQVRALGWQCFKFNYSAYLIWDVRTPYNARGGHAYQGWSGGSLLYADPGGYADGYVLSTRMELVRDGFEDHDYFVLLRDAVERLEGEGRGAAAAEGRELLDRVDALMDGYVPTTDYVAFNALRGDVGRFLSEHA